MSLLMDALRRAEEEKKRVAADGGEVDRAGEATPPDTPAADADAAPPTVTPLALEPMTDVGAESGMNEQPGAVLRSAPAAGQDVGQDVGQGISEAVGREPGPPAGRASIPTSHERREPGYDAGRLHAADDGKESGRALELEPRPEADAADRADATMDGDAASVAAAREDLLAARQPADPALTIPSARAARSSLDDYFDESRSLASEAPTRRGAVIGAAADATDPGGNSQSHPGIAAHTVFTAGRRPRSRRVAAAIVLAVLAVAVVLLAGGLYYGLTSPAPPPLPVATAPAGVPAAVPSPPPPPTPLEPVTSLADIQRGEPAPAPLRMPADEGIAAVALPAATVAEAAGPVAAAPPQADDGSAGAPSAEAARSGAGTGLQTPPETAAGSRSENLSEDLAATSAGSSVEPAADLGDNTPAPSTLAAAPSPAPGPAMAEADAVDVGVGAGQLRISRSRAGPRIDADVEQAYAALQAGDDDRAETLYRQALARNPDNINARYGLAGLAMRQSRFDAAYEHYRAIADADPGDGRATAALLALEGAGADGESRLKRLVAEEPDNHLVHFSLGTFYARQQRWPYAQQAFFDALRLDSDNPDYAFNLAVSLDQMGKSRAALDYYRSALTLADQRVPRFDAAQVMTRIRALGQAQEQAQDQAQDQARYQGQDQGQAQALP